MVRNFDPIYQYSIPRYVAQASYGTHGIPASALILDDFTIQKRKANILLTPRTAKGALWAASHISAAEKEDSGFVLSIEDFGDIAKAITHAGFTVEQPK